ncbi:hypothetical protein OSTOST_23784 [Ostertagia ostertagi]
MLCVSGERIEVGSGGQTLKRSFARKYCIPSDIHLDSIRSHLDHNGVLIITELDTLTGKLSVFNDVDERQWWSGPVQTPSRPGGRSSKGLL